MRAGERARCGKVLRRSVEWPLDRFSAVEPVWRGRTVVIVGGGPSCTHRDREYVEGEHASGRCALIVINNGYARFPDADVHYFADQRWWEWHRHQDAFHAFRGQRCTIEGTGHTVSDPSIHVLRSDGVSGFNPDKRFIRTGLNSGYQALHIALHAEPARVVLVGYDMGFNDAGAAHWHDEHPVTVAEDWYKVNYAAEFGKLEVPAGIEVINASRRTTLRCFKQVPLESVFPDSA